jgi:hypothetical protein
MEDFFNKFKMAVVDRIEGDFAVLVFDDDAQKLNWPRADLPAGVVEGDRLKVVLLSDKDERKEKEELAKAVLNELLKTD